MRGSKSGKESDDDRDEDRKHFGGGGIGPEISEHEDGPPSLHRRGA